MLRSLIATFIPSVCSFKMSLGELIKNITHILCAGKKFSQFLELKI